MDVFTHQAAAEQLSRGAPGDWGTDEEVTIGFSRSGAVVTIYTNGFDTTDISGTHIDPDTCARSAKIGIYDDKSSFPFKGLFDMGWLFTRHLSPQEHLNWHKRLASPN